MFGSSCSESLCCENVFAGRLQRRQQHRSLTRSLIGFEEANEETRNEHNTMSYECTRILLNDINSMTIQRGYHVISLRRLTDVYHHARGRELTSVSTAPEARG